MIATQRIEQLEMELQRNNAKPQQEYPHVVSDFCFHLGSLIFLNI
jgi:hypothetical protein